MNFFYLLILSLYLSCHKAPDSLFIKEALRLYDKQTGSSTKYFTSKNNLSGILSTEYYEIKAQFSKQDSHLELFSHSRSIKLRDGIRVKIERENENLRIMAGIQAYPDKILLEKKNYFKNKVEFNGTLKIENGTLYGFRIQIWENFLNKTGEIKKPTKILTQENQIVDSLNQALTFYEKGQGLTWGIKTFHSYLVSAFRLPNKDL
ncbi:MAG: hypothetical protein GDA46_02935 [Bdellovibrionales bacterium]|nr:hypothetical protein [Bdellovibrionales bacterium]